MDEDNSFCQTSLGAANKTIDLGPSDNQLNVTFDCVDSVQGAASARLNATFDCEESTLSTTVGGHTLNTTFDCETSELLSNTTVAAVLTELEKDISAPSTEQPIRDCDSDSRPIKTVQDLISDTSLTPSQPEATVTGDISIESTPDHQESEQPITSQKTTQQPINLRDTVQKGCEQPINSQEVDIVQSKESEFSTPSAETGHLKQEVLVEPEAVLSHTDFDLSVDKQPIALTPTAEEQPIEANVAADKQPIESDLVADAQPIESSIVAEEHPVELDLAAERPTHSNIAAEDQPIISKFQAPAANMDEEEVPIPRGAYTINWDEIDEFADPFAMSKPSGE